MAGEVLLLWGCEGRGTLGLLCGAGEGRAGLMLPQWTPCVPHVAGAWKALAFFPRLTVVTALLWSPLLLWGWVASMGGVSFWALSVLSQGQMWEELVPLSPQVSHIPVPGCSMLFRGAAERLRTRLGAVPSPAPAPAPSPLCSGPPAEPSEPPGGAVGVASFRRLPPSSALFPRLPPTWWVRVAPSAAILGRARGPAAGNGGGGPEGTGARGSGERRGPGWLGKEGFGVGDSGPGLGGA